MIPRRLHQALNSALREFPAVAMLGPRQVGKTTLARDLGSVAEGAEAPVHLDLENPTDLAKLADPAGYLGTLANRLVVLDEVQRLPGIFRVLRVVIDERIRGGETAGQFLLLGSASIDLLQQSSESLAGRVAYLELTPLDVLEVNESDTERLWSRGGFPRSFLAPNDEASATWRSNFISTYLERDLPLLGPRIPAETLRRFWTMLSHRQGSIHNAAELAGSLAVDGKTVARYLDLMVDLLLVRRLTPYHANVSKRLVKSPKTYVRDSGLIHTLLRLDTLEQILGHPVAGMSWEGFVIENLLRAAPPRTQPSFYRTAAGAEIDLVLELPGDRLWAIEIKRSSAPKVERGLRNALEDVQPQRAFVVYSGFERYPMGDGVEAIGPHEMARELVSLAAHGSAG